MKTLRKKILSKLASKPKLENKIPLDSQDFAIIGSYANPLERFLTNS